MEQGFVELQKREGKVRTELEVLGRFKDLFKFMTLLMRIRLTSVQGLHCEIDGNYNVS
jgi:hypothetical protein